MVKLLITESVVEENGSGNLGARIQMFYAYIWHLDFAQNLKKAKKTKEISLWGSKVKKVHVSGREVSQYWVVGMIDYQQ